MAILNYTTTVESYKTVAEIEQILVKHKAKSIMKDYQDESIVALSFLIDVGYNQIPIKLPAKIEECYIVLCNEKKKGTLEFTKQDFSTSETLPNTLIEIYNEDDELVFSGRTDENGKIIIAELEYGKYYILEKEAPEGYYLNEEKMYFEILEDGEIVKCTMTDEKVIVEVPNTEENNYIIPISIILMAGATGVVIYEEIKKRKSKNK